MAQLDTEAGGAQSGGDDAGDTAVAGRSGTPLRSECGEPLRLAKRRSAVERARRERGRERVRLIAHREGGEHEREQQRQERGSVDPRVEHPSRLSPRPVAELPGRENAWYECVQTTTLRHGMSERSTRILLVDDEQSIQTLLSYPLRKDGYDVVQAVDGREALERFEERPFDLVVLDVMLPKLDGLEVCRRLRSRSAVPIIMLTAKSEEIDKVVGLEIGADDYITKPFSMREFRSRVKAALRRSELSRAADGDDTTLEHHELRIDPDKRAVWLRGEGVVTTFVEFEILLTLARSPGRVFTRDMLLARVWGDSAYRDPRTIDVHIRHLREKIERDPKEPDYLFTVRGVGYRFRDTDE